MSASSTPVTGRITHLPLPLEHFNVRLRHARMILHQSRRDPAVELAYKGLPPQPQRLDIMWADVLDLFDNERSVGLGRDVVDQLRDRWEVSSREYVVVNEATAVS